MRRLIGSLVAVSVAFIVTASPAAAGEKKEVPLATKLAARSHPAVQLLATEYTAKLSVPTMGTDEGEIGKLAQRVIKKALNGEIPRDEQSMVKALLSEWAADVDRYSKPVGPNRSVDAKVTGTCTGWWVTADGYMVTGAHCVQPDPKELGQTFAKQALDEINKKDVEEMLRSIAKEGNSGKFDDEAQKKATEIIVGFNAAHLKMGDLSQSTTVLQGVQGGGVDKTAKALPAEVVSVGESYPGKDVAILKINGQRNRPTLRLGDDGDVQVGDTLYIDGFPGTVTNNDSLNLDTKLQPTFTQGPYNAQRTTQGGVPYLQTQAPAYGGNSGGPVFSDSGDVVGILIAGLVDGGSGQSAQNEQLVLPVSIVKEKLNEKNVKPAVSPTTRAYDEAMDAFFNRYYKRALPKLREVQALDPGHPYVAKYISDAQAAINAGKDETPLSAGAWLLILGGLGGGALVVLLVVVLLARGRRGGVAVGSAGPAGPGMPGQSVPGPGMAGPGMLVPGMGGPAGQGMPGQGAVVPGMTPVGHGTPAGPAGAGVLPGQGMAPAQGHGVPPAAPMSPYPGQPPSGQPMPPHGGGGHWPGG